MTTFTIGLIAAGLWLAVVVAVYLLARTSPGHPFRSISGFRRARRGLSPEPVRPKVAAADQGGPRTLVARLPEPAASTSLEPPAASTSLEPPAEPARAAGLTDQATLDLPGWANPNPEPAPPAPQGTQEAPEEDPDLGHLLRAISDEAPRAASRANGSARRAASGADGSARRATPKNNGAKSGTRKRAAASKPRRIGKLTYVVVDEKGRPEASPERSS